MTRGSHRRFRLAVASLLLAVVATPAIGALSMAWHVALEHEATRMHERAHNHDVSAHQNADYVHVAHTHEGHAHVGHTHAVSVAQSAVLHAQHHQTCHAGDGHDHAPLTTDDKGLPSVKRGVKAPALCARVTFDREPTEIVARGGDLSSHPTAAPSLSRLCTLLI